MSRANEASFDGVSDIVTVYFNMFRAFVKDGILDNIQSRLTITKQAHDTWVSNAKAPKITERKAELAKLEAIDCGKPLDETSWDMDDVADCFKYYADLAEGLDGKQMTPLSLPMDTFKGHVLKEPIGIVGLITPWNYPLLMATWKVAPALAAGCAAILKPSELSSLTCLELADVCKEVGLPPGVLNILTGLGPKVGALLATHPHVDKIAFTRSTATSNLTSFI